MSVEEITAAVAALSRSERRRLYAEVERQKAADRAASGEEVSDQNVPSAHERAKHLIGEGSGCGDLSANPAYLEGFGEEGRP